MGKDGWQQRVQVDIKRTEGAVPSDHRTESVGLCWTEKQRHALPAGMTAKNFGKKTRPSMLIMSTIIETTGNKSN